MDEIFPVLKHIKGLLLKIHWRSVDLIPALEHPMLFISGAQDKLVPPPMLRRLHDAAVKAASRELYVVDDADHNDTFVKGACWVGHISPRLLAVALVGFLLIDNDTSLCLLLTWALSLALLCCRRRRVHPTGARVRRADAAGEAGRSGGDANGAGACCRCSSSSSWG